MSPALFRTLYPSIKMLDANSTKFTILSRYFEIMWCFLSQPENWQLLFIALCDLWFIKETKTCFLYYINAKQTIFKINLKIDILIVLCTTLLDQFFLKLLLIWVMILKIWCRKSKSKLQLKAQVSNWYETLKSVKDVIVGF